MLAFARACELAAVRAQKMAVRRDCVSAGQKAELKDMMKACGLDTLKVAS